MTKIILITLAILFIFVDLSLVAYKYLHKDSKKTVVHPIHKAKPNYKYSVFLTSDDGPLTGSQYLDQLIRDYEVPFTLFLVGKMVSTNRDLVPSLNRYRINKYVLLGNHSFTHANAHYKRFYKNSDNVEKDFLQNNRYLKLDSNIARLPGRNVFAIDSVSKGDFNAKSSAIQIAHNHGYKFFGWDYELQHEQNGVVKQQSALYHYKKIKRLLKENKTFRKDQIIILMHDQMFTSTTTQKTVGELILLLQNDTNIKLKKLDKYKI